MIGSRARYTTPPAPRPSSPRIIYLPNFSKLTLLEPRAFGTPWHLPLTFQESSWRPRRTPRSNPNVHDEGHSRHGMPRPIPSLKVASRSELSLSGRVIGTCAHHNGSPHFTGWNQKAPSTRTLSCRAGIRHPVGPCSCEANIPQRRAKILEMRRRLRNCKCPAPGSYCQAWSLPKYTYVDF